MLRTYAQALSPSGPRARLCILIYHRVLPVPDELFPEEVDSVRFATQVRALKETFAILPLAEAAAMLRDGRLPARAAAITFDDGYADNEEVAAPILRSEGLTATFFVASGYLDGGIMWNDKVIESIRRTNSAQLDLGHLGLGRHSLRDPAARRAAALSIIKEIKHRPVAERAQLAVRVAAETGAKLPDDLMMRSDQVRNLARHGMAIGGHTVSHPILTLLEEPVARMEIAENRRALEAMTGARVRLFAYPNGRPRADYDAANVDIVRREGFDAAVSTVWGSAGAESDIYQLPRFTPWDRSPRRFVLRLLANCLRRNAETA